MAYLFLALLTLSTLLLYTVDPSFRFYAHFLLSLLVHGVSGGKIYLLLLYSSAMFLLLFLLRKRPGGHGTRWDGKILWCSVMLGMGASLGSYLHYLLTFSLPIEAYHYHFREVYNSVNYFPHIHTSKVFLYRLADLIGLGEVLGAVDDGRVFATCLPKAYAYVTFCSVLTVCLLSFILVPRMVLRWGTDHRIGISVLLVLAFHSILKCLSDGGPFAYDFLIAIAVLSLLFHAKEPQEVWAFLKKKWKVFFWTALGIFSLKCLIDPSLCMVTYTLKNGSALLAIYALISLISLWGSLRHPWRKRLLLLGLAAFLVFMGYPKYSIYIRPFLTSLEEGTTVHYFHYKDRPLPERLVGSLIKFDSDFLTIYSFSLERKERVLDLYRTLKENPYRNRRTAILLPKKRQGYGMLAELVFLEFQRRETSLRVPPIMDLQLKEGDLERKRFYGAITFDPSYFPMLAHAEGGGITQLDENHKFLTYYFLNRFFYHSGVTEYILTPMGFYRFN